MLVALLAAAPEDADWQTRGRPLPPRESRAIGLDPRLQFYAPCRSELTGQHSGSVTAILPDLFSRWTQGFSKVQPGVGISAALPYGPPQGRLSQSLDAFLRGESDFALVSRELTGEDRATYRAHHGGEPVVVPVAAGSWRHFGFVDTVVVIVNAANPIDHLSFAQIDAIFSAARLRGHRAVKNWGELGVSSWPDRPIHLVGGASWRNVDSARSVVIRNRVLKGGAWRAELATSGDEASAPERVAADPEAIAITGLGHLPAGTRAVAISVEPGGPFVAPSREAVSRGRYPLSRTVDLILPHERDGTIEPQMAEFGRFMVSHEGQQIVADQGVFMPLRAAQAENSLRLLGRCPKTSQPHSI